jgi:1-acyl-sn-glycerol-3-phosphate acyltransferase
LKRAETRLVRWAWRPVNFVQGVYTVLWTGGLLIVALLLLAVTGRSRSVLGVARRIWSPGLVYGAGARVVVRGLERVELGRAHLVVANHSSWIDVPALIMALPVELRFLAKRELARVPLLGRFIAAMGMVFVDRADARRGRQSVGRAADLLARGDWVVSFPEGTRSRDGRRGRFKTGGFGAALESGVPVLPVGIVGAGAVLPADGFAVRPGRIEVRIGAPIATAGLARDARAELARAAERAVEELLAPAAS